jgi:minor extracellular serine protease Vpr
MMKTKRIFCICISLLFIFSTQTTFAQNPQQTIKAEFLQEAINSQEWFRVLIEFKDLPGVEYWTKQYPLSPDQNPSDYREQLLEQSASYQNLLMEKQEAFINWASNAGIKLIPDQHILLVLNAITAEILSCDIPKLLSHPQILHVHDDRPSHRFHRSVMAHTTGADKVWKGISSDNIPASKGSNKLIGIIDSGLDRFHPDFKSSQKIKGGFNTVDNSSVITDEQGHGTHVAGIAAGYGSKVEHQGIAYEAQLMIYKAASSKYPGAIINWLVGVDRSVRDKCDVLNLSFGRNTDEPSKGNSSEYRAIANADAAGVLVVASAGNEGPRRKEIPWPIGSPALIDEAFSVAASNDRNEEAVLQFYPGKHNERIVKATHSAPTPKMTADHIKKGIVFAEYGRSEDFDQVQVKDKIALIKRGPSNNSISFRDKVENALKNGAIGVILFNDIPSEYIFSGLLKEDESPDAVKHLPPTITITLEDGEYLQSILSEYPELTLQYQSFRIISIFSSMGPTGDFAFKPEISVPGTQILSSIPKNKYAAWDGTSMASPGMAGLSALVKQARSKWSHAQIKSAFMNTAEIMINPLTGLPFTFLIQGAGNARLDKALCTPAFIEPRSAIFHGSARKVSQVFTVTNASNSKQTFKLSAEFFHHDHEKLPVRASISPSEISVEANQEVDFTYTLEIDRNAFLQSRYEGVIRLNSELHIPIICYKDSPGRTEEAISNVRMSHDLVDLSLENADKEDYYLSFSMNAGVLYSLRYRGYDFYNSFHFNSIYITLTDRNGEVWGELKPIVGAMVGEYRIKWNPKNEKNRYYLPKGSYTFTLTTYKYELVNEKWERRIYSTSRQSLNISKSSIPDPVPASFSALKIYGERQDLSLGLKFDDIRSFISQTEDVSSISFELKYDSKRLSYRDFQVTGFLSQVKARVDIDKRIGDDTLFITIECQNLSPEQINNLPFLNLYFRTANQGRVNISSRAFLITLENEDEIRVNTISPSIRILDKPYLLSDLNNDKIVDRFDMEIFHQSFGFVKGEKKYNEDCDFNQDQRIDMLDYFIISREMGSDIL